MPRPTQAELGARRRTGLAMLAQGELVRDVARALRVDESTVDRWQRNARKEAKPAGPKVPPPYARGYRWTNTKWA